MSLRCSLLAQPNRGLRHRSHRDRRRIRPSVEAAIDLSDEHVLQQRLDLGDDELRKQRAAAICRFFKNGDRKRPDATGVRPCVQRSRLGQGVFLQAVALGGIVRYLRGDRPTQWTTVRR